MSQEAFLSAYESIRQFDGKNEKAWICRIAKNKCLDYLKASGRKSLPTEDSYFTGQEDRSQTPEQQYLEKEVREELLQSCRQLHPPYNEIATDYYYHEMSAEEIAAKRGRNLKTVQTQIYRARGMLRKHYRKEDGTYETGKKRKAGR